MKRFNKVRKPKHLEFYTIYEGADGVKRIHIFGYCYKADDHWANMECNHFTDTVKEFVANIKADADYVDNTYQVLNQYQGDHSAQEMADIINRYFDGKPAGRYLAYGDITEETPCGDYVYEYCKPRTPAESLRRQKDAVAATIGGMVKEVGDIFLEGYKNDGDRLEFVFDGHRCRLTAIHEANISEGYLMLSVLAKGKELKDWEEVTLAFKYGHFHYDTLLKIAIEAYMCSRMSAMHGDYGDTYLKEHIHNYLCAA